MIARRFATAVCAATLAAAGTASARSVPSAAPTAESDVAELHARGQILAIDARYVIFTTGDAIRLRPGTAIPKGATLGSVVLVTLEPGGRDVREIALEAPRVPNEIAIADVPRPYVVAAPKSARTSVAAPAAATAPGGANVAGSATVTLEVTVPSNTPPSDDVYVATDRSNYSPAESRMQRVDARRFSATISLGVNGKLKYQYTRGTYASVERDRSGGIVEPHTVDRPRAKIEDSVTRWADLN